MYRVGRVEGDGWAAAPRVWCLVPNNRELQGDDFCGGDFSVKGVRIHHYHLALETPAHERKVYVL